jgi:hypothetical protein
MTGNIIGEPIDGYVQQQIGIRQLVQSNGYDNSRTSNHLNYLTNRNAWVKLASSVEITATGLTKLSNIKIENPQNYLGTELAKKAILFNTLSSYTDSKSDNKPSLNFGREGVASVYVNGLPGNTLWNNNFAYGIGGKDFGLQPPPGIIGVTVNSLNRGSIRKANVNLKAHNRFQFDIIELLYLRLGFTMMLEWGWDKYLSLTDNNIDLKEVKNTIIEEKWFTNTGYSQIGMLNTIESYRNQYSGNYDGFFGKVSNFTWNYNSDGTYDISIDLITIGDVIESLKVNTSSKIVASTTSSLNSPSTPQEPANNITQASYLNTIGYFLYKKAVEIGGAKINGTEFKNVNNTTPSFALSERSIDTFLKDGKYNYFVMKPSTQVGNRTSASGNQSLQFYIRLKEFFAQLELLVIPRIDNNLQLKFELDSCYMSHFPNQISFDPNICVFKYPLDYGDIPVYGVDGEGVYNPASSNAQIGAQFKYLQYLENYSVKKGDYTYGDLMNIYVNFEFISGLLLSNGGPDQDLSLFKFLQDLCNGINNALGGVNKLEPIIKDDYIITIIDQTFSSSANNSVNLNVFGYDTKTKTSNFVKDIKFVSKITPQLASTITIGATAGGSSTSEIDGTAFSKWSTGLIDRFSRVVAEPSGVKVLVSQSVQENETAREQRYTDEWNELPSVDINSAEVKLTLLEVFLPGALPWFDETVKESAQISQTLNKIVPPGSKYQGLVGKKGGVSLEEFKRFAREQEEDERRRNILEVEDLQDLVCTDYYFYLINAFGGRSNKYQVPFRNKSDRRDSVISRPYEKSGGDARYLEFNDNFISQGKSAYKNYLNMLNNERYKLTNIPSNEIGFIPLSFELTLDGISGVKIYNKLNVNNNFLPANYPNSLKFVITKVDHNISDNSWETSLSTISIPQTSEYKFGEFITPITPGGGGNLGGGGGRGDLPGAVEDAPRFSLTRHISLEKVNGPTLQSKYKNNLIYIPAETKKTMVMLHHTAGNQLGDKAVIERTIKSTFQREDYPIATHYIIQDGIGFEPEYVFPEKYWSVHCGAGVDQYCLSVEIGAYGFLEKNKQGQYINDYNEAIPADQVAQTVDKCGNPAPYRGYYYMHKYTPSQIAKLKNLFIQWKNNKEYSGVAWEFNFDEMFPPSKDETSNKSERTLSQKAIKAVPGVYSHCSTQKGKVDVMPQLELIQMLREVLDHKTPGMDKCPRNSPSLENK